MTTEDHPTEDPYGGAPYADEFSSFSAGYILVENVEVRRWSDEIAGMPWDLYETLALYVGEPLVGYTGGLHYEFRPMQGIPDKTAAVPRDNHKREPGPLLLQK